jgi:hypothetical protein
MLTQCRKRPRLFSTRRRTGKYQVWLVELAIANIAQSGLMLVGYSLEICLKAMAIIEHGSSYYASNEKKYYHHRLNALAEFVPELNDKELEVLKLLSEFSTWAGRYPDPGKSDQNRFNEVWRSSETLGASLRDVLDVAIKIRNHAQSIVEARVGKHN